MIIERTVLPGIGMCHTAVTVRRQRLGVVCHESGRRDLVLYHPHDPERAAHAVVLEPAEARHVAEMLAATVAIDHIGDPQQHTLAVACVRLPADSAYDGLSLQELSTGWHGGLKVIAVIRRGHITADPQPDHVLHRGDTLVTAGEHAAITALAELLGDREPAPRRFSPAPKRLRRPPLTAPPR